MGCYPIFLEMAGRSCVVIGGGAVAERKVAALLEVGASVTIVSPSLSAPLETLARAGGGQSPAPPRPRRSRVAQGLGRRLPPARCRREARESQGVPPGAPRSRTMRVGPVYLVGAGPPAPGR